MQIPADGYMIILIFYNSWLQLIVYTIEDALEFLRNTENPADFRVVHWTPYRRKTMGNVFLEFFETGVQHGCDGD